MMERFLADLGTFFYAIWQSWKSLMSGILGILVWALGAVLEPIPLSLRWTFLVCGTIGLLFACFLVWRAAHHAAHPYAEETYRHAAAVFADLTDADRAILERIAVEKSVPLLESEHARIETTGFVMREPTLPRLCLHPAYALLVPKLIKEWQSKPKPTGGP